MGFWNSDLKGFCSGIMFKGGVIGFVGLFVSVFVLCPLALPRQATQMHLESIMQGSLALQHPLLGLLLSLLSSSWPQRRKWFSDTKSAVALDFGHTSWRPVEEIRL